MEDGSTEGQTLSLELPAALDTWLAERSSELDVDRSELVVQVLGGYRAAADSTDEDAVAALQAVIEEREIDLDEAVADSVVDGLYDRIEELERETDANLDDVRQRVVQVKQETDAKADAGHAHPELDRVDALDAELESLRERVADLEADVTEDLETDVADVQSKLGRLARIVARLHEERSGERDGAATLDEIRRTAALEGHEEAVCGSCGERVRISLLPEPQCLHCEYPFERLVDDSGGLFGEPPRLVGAVGAVGAAGATDEERTAPLSDQPAERAGDGDSDPAGDRPAMDGGSPVTTDGGSDD